MANIDVDIPNLPNTPELGKQLSSKPGQPLVLFPVRLETRFFAQADGNSELRVRVYPDTVHIDAHMPGLTEDEVIWGKHFWEQFWRAGNDENRRKAAWTQLAERFDPPRAAWIANRLKPLNPKEDRPQDPVEDEKPLPHPINFPTPENQVARAAEARLLPDFWTLLGYKGGRLVVNINGNQILQPLAVGPDPSPSATVDIEGIDTGMKWTVDFDVAEKVGMGIRVKLKKEDAAAGFDFLLVMGIKDSASATTNASETLAQVFKNHHYTDGLSFVPPGMPSNNTTNTPSGFSSKDPGNEASYSTEWTTPSFELGDESNASVLTTALGLTNASDVFANLPYATKKHEVDDRTMNTALWQATWGYFLLQMLGVGSTNENPLTDDDIAWIRQHFIDYLRANGPLPAIRIGKQPYGILPVTSLDAWKHPDGPEDQLRREKALHSFLTNLRKVWRRSVPDVPHLASSSAEQGSVDDLLEMLKMDGLSSSYSIRHFMGRQYLEHLLTFLGADYFRDIWGQTGPVAEPPPEPEPTLADVQDLPKQARASALKQMRAEWAQQAKQRAAQFKAEQRAWTTLVRDKTGSITEWWAIQERLATTALQALEINWRPRLAHGIFAPAIANLKGTIVQADQGLALSPNYIEDLLAARSLNKIRFKGLSIDQPEPHTLLHLMLRHSMLLEYASAASRLLIKNGLLQLVLRREPELVDLPMGQVTLTTWRQMVMKIPVADAGPLEVGNYLLGFIPSGDPDVARDPALKHVSEFRASLAHLKSLSVTRLDELLRGTLDLCSHRLDAWITSLATKRLKQIRKANPTGLLFGGYGWVMNLKPAVPQTKVPAPAGEEEPAFLSPNNPGFIHTPSLTQAVTAAILRSGHLTHAGSANQNDLLAVDLSSERVRLAMWLLDGVREGQPLGALLGYRFERRLQEIGKPQFIAPFRELAPLVAGKREQTNQPPTGSVENIAANNVVDGLALSRRWQKGKSTNPPQWNQDSIPFGNKVGEQITKLPPAVETDAGFKSIREALDYLENCVDAVSDALLAESVYHTVRGNPLRASNTIESIAGGETPVPELEVVNTPRSGIAITHRLITLMGGDSVPESVPPVNAFRAKAEPNLNAWVAKLLPNPAKVRCVVERLEPETEIVLESKELRLSELRLTPLDFIYAGEGGQGGQQAEIEQRIMYTMMRKPDGFPPDSLLRVNPNRKPEWKLDELGYGDFSEMLRAARKLFTTVRGIDDRDLNPPERNVDFNVDVQDLDQRVAGAEKALDLLIQDLTSQLGPPETEDLESLRESIVRASGFGVAGAVPLSAGGNSPADRQTLILQATSILKELTQRFAQKTPAGAEGAMARLRIIFGKGFVVLPRFRPANGEELQQALGDSTKLQDGDPLAVTTWFQQMARVRDAVGRLNTTLTYSEAINTGEKLNLSIAQLPFDTDDRWVGLPLKPSQTLPGGKLSLVVQSTAPVDVRQSIAGLFIDEWVEVVPSSTETTGIALQYDQPNAAPPQNILIAVPPEIESPWTVWSLQEVLLETLDLARIRAVDLEALKEVGHFLPALYFAWNTNGETVSTDFMKLK
jgi:hypothetical protein